MSEHIPEDTHTQNKYRTLLQNNFFYQILYQNNLSVSASLEDITVVLVTIQIVQDATLYCWVSGF